MKLSRLARIRIVAGAVSLLALSVPGLASASGLTLNLTAPSPAVVGKTMVLHATGTIPPEDFPFLYWFSLDAIPTSVTTTCPQGRWEGVQFARASGGSVVVLNEQEVPDAAGNFSIPVAVTPSAPGSVLLCGYTDDGEAGTLVVTSLILNIQPGPSTTGSSGQSGSSGKSGSQGESGSQGGNGSAGKSGSSGTTIPAQARSGIRSCLALLGPKDGRSCIRSAVRRANGACRRLHPAKSRTSCLRAVGKIARRHS